MHSDSQILRRSCLAMQLSAAGDLRRYTFSLLPRNIFMKSDKQTRIENDDRGVAIYHIVYAHEGFNQSAQSLFKIVKMAEQQQPGKKRILCLDIEGHRDPDGYFDADMYELQDSFCWDF